MRRTSANAGNPRGGEGEGGGPTIAIATRKIAFTAKGRRRAPGLKRKLGLDSDSEEDADRAKKKKEKGKRQGKDGSAGADPSSRDIVNDDIANISSMDHAIPMLPGANLLFKAQKNKSLSLAGNRTGAAQGGGIKMDISTESFQAFRKNLFTMDPLYKDRKNLVSKHVSDCQNLIFYIMLGHNVLFHGIGDKLEFLNEFAHSFAGEDVLEIDGRDNPRDFAREEQSIGDDRRGGALGSGLGLGLGLGLANIGASQDLTVKALLRRINALLPGARSGLGLGGTVFDVVETARFLAESLELHYGHNALGRYDSMVERVVLEHVQEVGRTLVPKPSSSSSSESKSKSKSTAALQPSSDSYKLRNENIIRRYLDTKNPTPGECGGLNKYANAVSRLYIVVHSLDGDGLASPRSQEALAVLAACPSISVLASCDHLNCPLLWTTEISSTFNWLYVNVTTYQPYIKSLFGSTVESFLHGESKHTTNAYQGSQLFCKGLTARHRDVVSELIFFLQKKNMQSMLNDNSSSNSSSKGSVPKRKLDICGMLKSELYDNCKKKLLFNNMGELTKALKELAEQNMVQLSNHSSSSSGKDFITINMTFAEMDQFLKTAAT